MATAQLGTLLRHIHKLAAGPNARPWTDRELLDDFASRRDESAFSALVARHGPMVLRVCRRVLGHEQDAEDAFQATFLVLARGLGSIRKRESLANWLHGVAFRTAMKSRRSAVRRRNHEARSWRAGQRKLPGIDPAAHAAGSPSWNEIQSLLDEEIQRLPDPLRSAFVLRVLEGKSGPEAAAELGCREGTVSTRLVRARRLLQDRLARRGIQLSALLAALTIAEGAKAALPVTLSRLAVQSGLLAAAGKTPAALIPAHVADLAAGVTRAMFLTKVKIAVAILLAAGVLSACCLARSLASGENASSQEQPANAKPQAAEKSEGIRLTGRVLDPDGKPVVGATLYWPRLAKMPPESEEDYTLTKKSTTNDKGQFELNLKPSEMEKAPRHYLIAAADGFGFDWVEIAKDEKPAELTLRLVKDAPVQGRVVDTQGRPIAGVKLNVTGVQASGKEKVDNYLTIWKQNWHDTWRAASKPLYAFMNTVLQTAPTDKDGRFTIRGLGVERVATVEVQGSSIAKTTLYVVTRAGFDAKAHNDAAAANTGGPPRLNMIPQLYGPTFDYIAVPTRIIEGAIIDVDTRKPIAGAHIYAGTGYNSQVSAVSDAQGSYKLTGLPKMDEYLVGVSPREKESNLLSRTIAVPGPEGLGPIKQDIELAHGVVVTGQITDKSTGKGVEGGVRFVPLPDNKFFGKKPGYDAYRRDHTMLSTDADGKFRIVIIPGSGVLMAQIFSRNEKLEGQPINPFRAAEFDEEDAKIAKPVNNDGDRIFTAAGNSIEFLGHEGCVKVLDFAEGTQKATVNLFANRGKTLAFRVEDPDGKPLPGTVVSGMTELWPGTFNLKKAEGTLFALDGIHQRHVVFYHRERKLGGHIIVRGDEKEAVTVHMEPLGTVTGRLLDPDGQPIPNVEVALNAPLRVEFELYRFLSANREPVKTDKDGKFRLEGVLPKLIFQLSLRQGRTYYQGEPRIGDKQVGPGKTLELGDVRVRGTQF